MKVRTLRSLGFGAYKTTLAKRKYHRSLRSGEAQKPPFTTLEDRYYRMKVCSVPS